MATNDNRKRFNIIANKNESLILVSLFAFSFLIRAIGAKHGFPLLTRPDEELIMDQVFFMSRDGFFYPGNPGTFARPNQILYTLHYVFLNTMSYLRFGEGYAARYLLYELHFYHYGRLLTAVIGSFIPVVAYLIGKLIKPGLALAAGLVFMLFPSFVLHSIFITPDVPITLFTLLVIYFTLRYLVRNETWALYVAAGFAAVNTAEKYPGLISLGIVLLGVIIQIADTPGATLKAQASQAAIRILKVVGVFVGTLLIVAPKLFINYSLALAGIFLSADSNHPGVDHLGYFGRLAFYARAFGSWSNLIALIFIAAGCYALLKWRKKETLLLLYGAVYWVLLSTVALHWERWALPMYITPLFLIAAGITFMWDIFHTKPVTRWVAIAIIGLFFVHQLIFSIHTPIRRSFTDTRVKALEYCSAQGITQENSLYEGYTPLQDRQRMQMIFDAYQAMGSEIEYILLSSDMFGRYYQDPQRFALEVSIYDEIRTTHQLLARFEPSPEADRIGDKVDDILYFARQKLTGATLERYRGPIIEIYKVSP